MIDYLFANEQSVYIELLLAKKQADKRVSACQETV